MLSVPRPSLAARFEGHILSSINSTILESYIPPKEVPTIADPPFTNGETPPELARVLELDLLSDKAEVEVIFFAGD